MNSGVPIQSLKQTLAGEKIFVLGNGPSVSELALDKLEGQHVIGMNASTLLEEQHGFTAAYYVASDARFLEHPEKRAYGTTKVAPSTQRVLRADLWDVDDARLRDRTAYVRPLGRNGFSSDLQHGFYFGCTTTMLAVQLAAYLGCSSIYLLGCDFKYSGPQPRFYAESVPQDPDPFLSVQLWNLRQAFVTLRARSVSLLSCSRGSNLRPYLPFCSFDEALARPA